MKTEKVPGEYAHVGILVLRDAVNLDDWMPLVEFDMLWVVIASSADGPSDLCLRSQCAESGTEFTRRTLARGYACEV